MKPILGTNGFVLFSSNSCDVMWYDVFLSFILSLWIRSYGYWLVSAGSNPPLCIWSTLITASTSFSLCWFLEGILLVYFDSSWWSVYFSCSPASRIWLVCTDWDEGVFALFWLWSSRRSWMSQFWNYIFSLLQLAFGGKTFVRWACSCCFDIEDWCLKNDENAGGGTWLFLVSRNPPPRVFVLGPCFLWNGRRPLTMFG